MTNYKYAHMCRMDHTQIGHNDSENEACPLCIALAENELLRADLALLAEARESGALERAAGDCFDEVNRIRANLSPYPPRHLQQQAEAESIKADAAILRALAAGQQEMSKSQQKRIAVQKEDYDGEPETPGTL